MLRKIKLYLNHQIGYLLTLFLVFVLPLAMFFQFSSYPLPKVQYVFLGCLFISQYAFYSEKDYRRKIEAKVVAELAKELRRTPSINEIAARESFIVSCRGGTIFFIGLSLLLVMFYFKQF